MFIMGFLTSKIFKLGISKGVDFASRLNDFCPKETNLDLGSISFNFSRF